jgi:hypothetical protein
VQPTRIIAGVRQLAINQARQDRRDTFIGIPFGTVRLQGADASHLGPSSCLVVKHLGI